MWSYRVKTCALLLLLAVWSGPVVVGARRVGGRRLHTRKADTNDARRGTTGISVGSGYFCAVSKSLDVHCWGTDPETGESIRTPVQVSAGGTQFTSVSVGLRYLCAVAVNGTAFCRGKGFHGELGTGVKEEVLDDLVVPVQGDLAFRQVTTGLYHACGVTTDNELYCWGDNEYGQLGTGDETSSAVPAKIGAGWSSVSAGGDHTCGTKLDGKGYCWGLNDFHQVSPGEEYQYSTPQKVQGTWRSLYAGYSYTLGIDSKGQGYGWGIAENIAGDSAVGGNLGDGGPLCLDLKTGNVTCKPSDGYAGYASFVRDPVPMKGDRKWKMLSPGKIPCGIEAKTKYLYCWGYTAGEGYAAGSPGTNVPMLVSKSSWDSVATGISGARCGIDAEGQAFCWGRNEYDCFDQCPLGDGDVKNSDVPAKVVSVDRWRSDSGDDIQNVVPDEDADGVAEEETLPVAEEESLPVVDSDPLPLPEIIVAPAASPMEESVSPISENPVATAETQAWEPSAIEEESQPPARVVPPQPAVRGAPPQPAARVVPPQPVTPLPQSGTTRHSSIMTVVVAFYLGFILV